jgi:hypothetical protein
VAAVALAPAVIGQRVEDHLRLRLVLAFGASSKIIRLRW